MYYSIDILIIIPKGKDKSGEMQIDDSWQTYVVSRYLVIDIVSERIRGADEDVYDCSDTANDWVISSQFV